MSLLRQDEHYTYEDWLSWDEDVRAEIVDGALYMMALPTRKHQKICGEIFGQLWSFLKGKPCKVFPAPFGVRLTVTEDTAFEPDIVVVCDHTKLDDRMCNGAPDMIVEVLSPTTARMDTCIKFNKFREAGVREYWIVNPDSKTVQVCTLHSGLYVTTMYPDDVTAPVSVLPGCGIDLREVFSE